MPHQGPGGVGRGHSSSLYDVLELILDKGLVIDAYIRVSLVGIELLTIDIRVVIASVDTYLRFAEAVNRLDLSEKKPRQLPEFVGELSEQGASGKTKGALSGAAETFTEAFRKGRGGGEDEDEREREEIPRPRGSSRERSERRDD
ncbi:gas vesicle structural protein GvpA [Actinopolymorpha sp. B11F2]|uniref:gas vesicle structural protein GvpA n=1 Tax=Actinopolymorpha sp. B11F2 TaxID=3160862 RepID=UPI0032E5061A